MPARTSLSLFLLGLLLRAGVGLGPHSGLGHPPMHGDFEAQRHWMEITANLPVEEWYRGWHPSNDLQYWGLDYPPLTAYHSLALGKTLQMISPESVALLESRGSETSETRTWMRATALLSDALTFLPAIIYYLGSSQQKTIDILFAVTSPALILIDHGHFQFNCVAHGLAVLAWAVLDDHGRGDTTPRRAVLSSILFCLSLNFKQMSLYYAPVMFFYLFGWAMTAKDSVKVRPVLKVFLTRLVLLGMTVIATFALVWAPFLYTGTAPQVLRRVFPFERGLFEDKVANFWCTLNVAIKWRSVISRNANLLLAFVVTVATIAPSCVLTMFKHRGSRELRWPLFTVSLSFFLFSFQVHEKSILLPLVPAVLLADEDFFTAFWFSMFASVSMVPLFVKDRIVFTAFALMGLYAAMAVLLRPHEFTLRDEHSRETKWQLVVAIIAFIGLLGTTGLILAATPPQRYPDLFVVMHNSLSFVVFFAFWVLGNNRQLEPKKQPTVSSSAVVDETDSGGIPVLELDKKTK